MVSDTIKHMKCYSMSFWTLYIPWHGRGVGLQRDGHRLPEVVHLVRRHHEPLDLAVVQEAEVQGATCGLANFMLH